MIRIGNESRDTVSKGTTGKALGHDKENREPGQSQHGNSRGHHRTGLGGKKNEAVAMDAKGAEYCLGGKKLPAAIDPTPPFHLKLCPKSDIWL